MSISHYVVAGYGRVGKRITEMLLEHGNKVTVFDSVLKEIELKHDNLTYHNIDVHAKEDLEQVGFPDITGFLITTGSFLANTSLMLMAEKYFPRTRHDYQLIIRAISNEDRDIYVKSADPAGGNYNVVYSEEAGAQTLAASIMEMYERREVNHQVFDLKITINGDGSDLLIKLAKFYGNHKINIFNEFFDNLVYDNTSIYYTVIINLKENQLTELKEILRESSGVNYVLSKKYIEESEEIIEESRFVANIISEIKEQAL